MLTLFIFGGEVTRGFSFAMLIGVVTGTYSSIFVAAPILIEFAKDKPLGAARIKSDKKKAQKRNWCNRNRFSFFIFFKTGNKIAGFFMIKKQVVQK